MSEPSPAPEATTETAPASPSSYQRAVVGIIAFARTVACTRYAKDADKAPTMTARMGIMRMSAAAVAGYDRLAQAAAQAGVDTDTEAQRFVGALGDADERLRPSDWHERLVKTYLAFGLLTDFCAALAQGLQEPLRTVLLEEIADKRLGTLATDELLGAIDSDAQLSARLGLWGRRVVGEEIGALQRLLAAHPELAEGSADVTDLHQVLSRGAVSRMAVLGLRG